MCCYITGKIQYIPLVSKAYAYPLPTHLPIRPERPHKAVQSLPRVLSNTIPVHIHRSRDLVETLAQVTGYHSTAGLGFDQVLEAASYLVLRKLDAEPSPYVCYMWGARIAGCDYIFVALVPNIYVCMYWHSEWGLFLYPRTHARRADSGQRLDASSKYRPDPTRQSAIKASG